MSEKIKKLKRTFTRGGKKGSRNSSSSISSTYSAGPLEARVGTLERRQSDIDWVVEAQLPNHPRAHATFQQLQTIRNTLHLRRKEGYALQDKADALLARVAVSKLRQHLLNRESAAQQSSNETETTPTLKLCPTREVRLLRPEPGTPLGMILEVVTVPARTIRGKLDEKNRMSAFVQGVSEGSVADKAGLKVGDEVLSIDGISTEQKEIDNINNQILLNEGTIHLSVRFSFDYKRILLFKKIAQVHCKISSRRKYGESLEKKADMLRIRCEQQRQQKDMLDVVESWDIAPAVGDSDDEALDMEERTWLQSKIDKKDHLSEADVVDVCGNEEEFSQAILDMQQAWREERRMFEGSKAILLMRIQKQQEELEYLKRTAGKDVEEPHLVAPAKSFEIDLSIPNFTPVDSPAASDVEDYDPTLHFDDPPPIPPSDDEDTEHEDHRIIAFVDSMSTTEVQSLLKELFV